MIDAQGRTGKANGAIKELQLTKAQIGAFWQRVDKKSGCWNWTGSVHGCPMYFPNRMRLSARRVAYALTHGEVPDRLFDTCGNQLCVNPAHMSDTRPGLISVKEFFEAAVMYATGDYSLDYVGRSFGVEGSTIARYFFADNSPFAVYHANIPLERMKVVRAYRRVTRTAVLDPHQVQSIRELGNTGLSPGQIRIKLGLDVSHQTVKDAMTARTWAWVP